MKTPLFFIAALVAFFALPLEFTAATSILFGAGLAAILFSDYSRTRYLSRSMARMTASVQSPERYRLAA
jgi:hypothetical protein